MQLNYVVMFLTLSLLLGVLAVLAQVDPNQMCPIDNTCEQLCALETIGGSGSGDITLEVCSCMNGFVLDENMENCTDIQECLQMPPVCNATQMCEDTPPGSFTCSCPPGTVINEEGTCVVTSSPSVSPSPSPVISEVERENSIIVTLSGLTEEEFTVRRQNLFRNTTAQAINVYCRQNPDTCIVISVKTDDGSRKRDIHLTLRDLLRRQNTVLASANDIVITSIEQTDDGLQVTFFVRGGSGEVITANAVVEAVQQAVDDDVYSTNGFIVTSVMLVFQPSSTPPDNNNEGLSGGEIAGIVIGVVVGVLLLVVIIILLVYCLWKRRVSGRLTLGPQKDDNDTIKNISYDPTTAGSRDVEDSDEGSSDKKEGAIQDKEKKHT